MRWLLRSGDGVHELRERGEPGGGGRRVAFDDLRAASTWLSRLLADPSDALRLRRAAGSLAHGAPVHDDLDVLARLGAGLISGRLILVRLGPVAAPIVRGAAEDEAGDEGSHDFSLLQKKPIDSHWIEIQLVGEDGLGLEGQRCLLVASDGTEHRGVTDGIGVARWTRLPPGACKVCFPELDADAWEALPSEP